MIPQEILYLKNKKVIKISGIDSVEFLNNILTSDITKLKTFEVVPSALLSPQGRILFDLLLSFDCQDNSKKNSILIEHDSLYGDELIKKLNMYNLRKKVKIERTNYKVFVTTNSKTSENILIDKRFENTVIKINRIYNNSELTSNTNSDFSFNWYNFQRYKHCIPEGAKEIQTNLTLPLEISFDLLGGISFEKGCFVGQEVNARMKWKGLVKRKYVPIIFKNKNFSSYTLDKIENNKVFINKNEIGEVIALSLSEEGDVCCGIAKIKLSQLYLFEENSDLECDFFGSKIKINFPKYMLPLPRKI